MVIRLFLVLLCAVVFVGCETSDKREGSPVLKDYVRQPLDRAQNVSDEADDRAAAVDEEIKEMDEED